MRRFLSALIAIGAFAATVAFVNSMGGLAEGGMNFNIADAAAYLARTLGEPVAAMAYDANVPLNNPGLISMLIGALALALPASFAFVLFSK
ncbi:MAG: hypothetical protein AAGJ70_13750 [Pseudomonadota bacterium]